MVQTLISFVDAVPDDRPAIAEGEHRVTYGQLRSAARRVAERLADPGRPRRCIVVKARPAIAFVEILLGTLYSGNVVVPVDPRIPDQGLAYILRKCRADAAIDPGVDIDEAAPASLVQAWTHCPEDLAMVMFTSGTTGVPKGVMMSHANLAHSWSAITEYLGLAAHPSTICVLPLHYSYGLISQLLCMLRNGGYVRIMAGLSNPVAFVEAVAREEIETVFGVPSTFSLLARYHRLRPFSLPSVRLVCSAGAAFAMALYPAIREMFPNAVVFNNYGMTEACPRISYVSDRDPEFLEGSCGVPMRGVEIVTLDPDSLAILPNGQEGVLGVRGPNIMAGYLDDDERNRRAFQRDGFLITGDVARIERGHLFLRGRLDDLFNVGGEKVAPLEIENVLDEMPEVELSAVRGLVDGDRGEIAAAFIIASAPLTKRRLDEFLSARLAPGKVPSAYFEVSRLPMTGSGKLQRALISETADYIKRRIY